MVHKLGIYPRIENPGRDRNWTMRSVVSLLLPLVFTVLISGVFGSNLLVKLNRYMSVRGTAKRVGNRLIRRFTAIPYATRRALLTRPQAVVYPEGKETVIDATTPGFVCPYDENWSASSDGTQSKWMQALSSVSGATQDGLKCTSLDIHVPDAPGKKRIVVFVHGGALTSGARNQALNSADGIYRFDALAETMWVSVGYSLGPLGFWTTVTEEGVIETNAALHEIILALKWVHAHAASFGGDLDDITIMGHSAGAALVQDIQFMLRKPAYYGFGTRQPFHKIVLMSGTSDLFRPIRLEEALARQQLVINETACRGAKDPLACLQGLSGKEIVDAASRAKVAWGPVIDGDGLLGDAEFHLRDGLFLRNVAVLLTMTADECGFYCSESKEDIVRLGHYSWEHFGHGDLIDDFEASYPSSNFGGCNYKCAIKCTTDALFVGPALNSAHYYGKDGLSVLTHEFAFRLERMHALVELLNGLSDLRGVVARSLSSIQHPAAQAGARLLGRLMPSETTKQPLAQLPEMGTFHGLDLALLFDAALSKNGAYHVEFFTQRKNAVAIFQPLFDFINSGTAATTPPSKNLPPTQCVDASVVVRRLYTGEAKASLAAKTAQRPPVRTDEQKKK